MVTSVLVSSKKPLVKSKDVIALNSAFTKMLYLTFPNCLFGAVAQSYLTCYLPGCSPHFATNKTQFTTLTWCSFFGQQQEIKPPMWKAPSLSPEIGLRAKRLYKQTLSLLYQFTTPNLNFFILSIPHRLSLYLKSIKAACLGHFFRLYIAGAGRESAKFSHFNYKIKFKLAFSW